MSSPRASILGSWSLKGVFTKFNGRGKDHSPKTLRVDCNIS